MAKRKQSDEFDPSGERLWELPLLDFIEAASKGLYKKPIHFEEVALVLSLAEQLTNARDVIAAPVQHGKTTIIEFVIAWILLRHPDRAIIYLTYAQRKAEKHSRRIRAIYTQCGGRLKEDFNTIQQWQTDQGGGLLVTSRDGEITGNDAVHIFFDDPYKDREEAENAETRERLEDKYSSEVVTRLAPGGSITIIASRWHEDDLSGVKIREGYRHTHLRAIESVEVIDDKTGEVTIVEKALCPWGPNPKYPRTLEFLRSIRDGNDVTEYDWASLYQGEPRPKGGGLFQGVYSYDPVDLPKLIAIAVGADFAYSSGGDRIAIVVLGLGDDGIVYILMVHVWRRSVLENIVEVRAQLAPWSGAEKASYVSGPEVGVIQHLARIEDSAGGPIEIMPLPAKLSKYVRAGRTARRWNTGGIRVRRGVTRESNIWTGTSSDEFVRRVTGFTGLDGARDDEVDAMVSGHDIMMVGETFEQDASRGFKAGRRCM